VAGVRYRALAAAVVFASDDSGACPLVFDVVDTWAGRSVGGCSYHVSHPAGVRLKHSR